MIFECAPFAMTFTMTQGGIVLSLFLGALVGSVSHCSFMCGPFVVMMQDRGQRTPMGSLLIPYHLGRMTTYCLLGVLSNLFLSYALMDSAWRHVVTSLLLCCAALMFLVQSFPLFLKYFPFLARLSLPLPWKWVSGASNALFHRYDRWGGVALYLGGVVLGFIPCGLVLAALLAVSALDGAGQAALAMAAFCVGTMPALIVIGIFGRKAASLWPTHFDLLNKGLGVVNSVVLIVISARLI